MPSNPFRVTLTAPSTTGGFGSMYAPDYSVRPFSVAVAVTTTSTTVSANVEHTYDYTGSSAFISSNAVWFVSSGVSSATGNAQMGYSYPVTAIRLNINSGSSAGATTMTCIQAG